MALKPSLQALWLAEEILHDEATGKVTVAGMFDQIEVDQKGADFTAPASLFFSLRDRHGRVEMTLLYVDLATNEAILERPLMVQGDPLTTTDVQIPLRKIPVPHAGAYAWELHWGEEMLDSSRLMAAVSAGNGQT